MPMDIAMHMHIMFIIVLREETICGNSCKNDFKLLYSKRLYHRNTK